MTGTSVPKNHSQPTGKNACARPARQTRLEMMTSTTAAAVAAINNQVKCSGSG